VSETRSGRLFRLFLFFVIATRSLITRICLKHFLSFVFPIKLLTLGLENLIPFLTANAICIASVHWSTLDASASVIENNLGAEGLPNSQRAELIHLVRRAEYR
jgi:hypothetical protein